jgi:hypothetical protein
MVRSRLRLLLTMFADHRLKVEQRRKPAGFVREGEGGSHLQQLKREAPVLAPLKTEAPGLVSVLPPQGDCNETLQQSEQIFSRQDD